MTDDDVEIPVVVEVPDRRPVTDMSILEVRTCSLRRRPKPAPAQVAV
jgi:hypothetical protein